MTEVPTNELIPARTVKLSLLLERHPIEECATVDDLVNCCNNVIRVYNRTALYTAYFLGLAFDEKRLNDKYNGMTVEKLGAAIGISRATAFRYRALTKILKPHEVDELGHIPYMCVLRFPEVEKQFGSDALKELKFRLQTNDFGGVRGTKAFDKLLEEMAQKRLELGATAPDIGQVVDAEEVIDDKQVINPCEIVEDDPNFDDSDQDESAVDKLLAARGKEANTRLPSERGKVNKAESKQQAEIALSQAKRCLQKIRDSYARMNDGILDLLHRVWNQEDYIIGDEETDELYRELLDDFVALHTRSMRVVLTLQKELREHGHLLGEIQMPEGATTSTLFDRQA